MMTERDALMIAQVLRYDMDNAELFPDTEVRKAGCSDRAKRMMKMLRKEGVKFDASLFLTTCGVEQVDSYDVAGPNIEPVKEYASPYFNKEDQGVWEGTVISIGEYTIKPKRDFGATGYYDSMYRTNIKAGFVVTKNGMNALPGASWTHTVDEAKQSIYILMAVGEEGYHGLNQALNMQRKIDARN